MTRVDIQYEVTWIPLQDKKFSGLRCATTPFIIWQAWMLMEFFSIPYLTKWIEFVKVIRNFAYWIEIHD